MTLLSPSHLLLGQATLIKQGAEARVYTLDHLYPQPSVYWPPSGPSTIRSSKAASSTPSEAPAVSSSSTHAASSGSVQSPPVILKYRFPKQYRHPSLDASLTRSRLSFEARALARCTRAGVVVPRVLWVDEKHGVIAMEKVNGWSIREVLGGGAEGEEEVEEVVEVEIGAEDDALRDEIDGEDEPEESEGWRSLSERGVTREDLMRSIGRAIARLHDTGIIHGDLTTSNLMVRLTPNSDTAFETVLIDFGLSSTATLPEHYAVDLYVLERAFASTHPASESLYAEVLNAYAAGLGEKKWKPIQTKLKEVRLRGRKRDMTG